MKRHRILLVEDDAETARSLAELFASIPDGFDCASVGSLQEAIPRIEKGDFCALLVDLHVRVSPKGPADVEAGHGILERARTLYPRRGENGKHLMPILVISGEAKERRHIERALLAEADGFLVKPYHENETPIPERIRRALREAGRSDHRDCAATTQLARSRASSGSSTSARSAAGSDSATLSIPARREHGRKSEVCVDDEPVLVFTSSFAVLIRVVEARLRAPDGWISKDAFKFGDEVLFKRISRLNKDLAGRGRPKRFVASDKNHRYRLVPEVDLGRIDWTELCSHSEESVRQVARTFVSAPS